jgi:hypothetical protein
MAICRTSASSASAVMGTSHQVFRCPEADCGCELTVTKAAPSSCTSQQDAPTCCCGKTMVKKSE